MLKLFCSVSEAQREAAGKLSALVDLTNQVNLLLTCHVTVSKECLCSENILETMITSNMVNNNLGFISSKAVDTETESSRPQAR